MRPLDLLNLNLKGEIQVQIKRNQRFIGTLAGFDEHLNIYVENAVNESEYIVDKPKTEESDVDDTVVEVEEVAKHHEKVGNIILRGDNIIFMKFMKPVFSRPQKRDYQKRRPYQGDRGPRGSGNYNRQRRPQENRPQGNRHPYKKPYNKGQPSRS